MYSCRYCQRPFATRQRQDQHEAIHENRRYDCDLCTRNYSSSSGLARHKGQMHYQRKDKSTTTMFSVCGNHFVCGICNKFFSGGQQMAYNVHLEEHTSRSDFGVVKKPREWIKFQIFCEIKNKLFVFIHKNSSSFKCHLFIVWSFSQQKCHSLEVQSDLLCNFIYLINHVSYFWSHTFDIIRLCDLNTSGQGIICSQ